MIVASARSGRWQRDGLLLRSEGSAADAIEYTGAFTDAVVRVVAHSYSGVVDVVVDDKVTASADLFQPEGSAIIGVTAATDLPYTSHTISIRPRGVHNSAARASQVLFEELVLLGPQSLRDGFAAPWPINRGNPYSGVIERYLAAIPEEDLVL